MTNLWDRTRTPPSPRLGCSWGHRHGRYHHQWTRHGQSPRGWSESAGPGFAPPGSTTPTPEQIILTTQTHNTSWYGRITIRWGAGMVPTLSTHLSRSIALLCRGQGTDSGPHRDLPGHRGQRVEAHTKSHPSSEIGSINGTGRTSCSRHHRPRLTAIKPISHWRAQKVNLSVRSQRTQEREAPNRATDNCSSWICSFECLSRGEDLASFEFNELTNLEMIYSSRKFDL